MKRILLIEDVDEIRRLLGDVLSEAGYEVLFASNGAIGLNLARATPGIDLVITDIFMPDKDGLEVISELLRFHPESKIIAMSGGTKGCSSHQFLKMANLMGAVRVLAKPFSPSCLLEVIAEIL